MSRLLWLRNLALALCAWAMAAIAVNAPAHAGVREYNAAVNAGDYEAATREAEAVWATFDKTRPETATVAREFAWTAMRAKLPEKALVFARFLVEQGAKLPTPDEDPLLSKAVFEWASLPAEPSSDERSRLAATLSAWAASNSEVGGRMGAVTAARLSDLSWAAGDWAGVERDAMLAEQLAERLGSDGALLKHTAIIDSAAANFIRTREVTGWLRIADALDALTVRLPPPRPDKGPDMGNFEPIYWRAEAWMGAMEGYFTSASRSIANNNSQAGIQRRVEKALRTIEDRRSQRKARCSDLNCTALSTTDGALCSGKWDRNPMPRYPSSVVNKSLIGVTIVRLTTDDAGKVTDAVILATAPSNVFVDQTLKTVKQWSFIRAADAKPGCKLDGARVMQFQYLIG